VTNWCRLTGHLNWNKRQKKNRRRRTRRTGKKQKKKTKFWSIMCLKGGGGSLPFSPRVRIPPAGKSEQKKGAEKGLQWPLSQRVTASPFLGESSTFASRDISQISSATVRSGTEKLAAGKSGQEFDGYVRLSPNPENPAQLKKCDGSPRRSASRIFKLATPSFVHPKESRWTYYLENISAMFLQSVTQPQKKKTNTKTQMLSPGYLFQFCNEQLVKRPALRWRCWEHNLKFSILSPPGLVPRFR